MPLKTVPSRKAEKAGTTKAERKNCKGKISNNAGKRPSKTEILLVIKTNINMMVAGLKVPCEKPSYKTFVQNLG